MLVRTLLFTFLLGLYTDASPLQCGNTLTAPCLAWSDKRYNHAAPSSNSIVSQNPLWKSTIGTWAQPTQQVDAAGNPRQPTHYDIRNGRGLPYRRDYVTVFRNQSIVGSRLYVHGIKIYHPVPKIFCLLSNFLGNTDGDSNYTSVIGNGTCGEHGHVSYFEYFGTTTAEKDGTVNIFWYNDDTYSGPADEGSMARFVGNDTVYYRAGKPGGVDMSTWMDVFVSAEANVIGGSGTDMGIEGPTAAPDDSDEDGGAMAGMTHSFYNATRSEVSEWEQAIRLAYYQANVRFEDRVGGSVAPIRHGCLSKTGRCPTEAEFCTLGKDPSCSPSPYQEPEAGVTLAAVLTISLICGAALILFGVVAHRMILQRKLKRQELQYKSAFVHQVTRSIDMRSSTSQVSAEELAKMITRINEGLKEAAAPTGRASATSAVEGIITREELWEFLSSGVAGNIYETDFTLLFDAIDIERRGKVNFVEFIVFLSTCGKDLSELEDSMYDKEMPEEEKIARASKRIARASETIASSQVTWSSVEVRSLPIL